MNTLLFLCVPLVFLFWSGVHEVSHYLVARFFVGAKDVQFRLYPHRDERLGFVWASVSWTSEGFLSPRQRALVSLAPRVPDVIGCVAFSLWGLLPLGWWVWLWLLFWGGAVVDMFVGSLGTNPESDLARAARAWDVSPWLLRVGGMAVVLVSLFTLLLRWPS